MLTVQLYKSRLWKEWEPWWKSIDVYYPFTNHVDVDVIWYVETSHYLLTSDHHSLMLTTVRQKNLAFWGMGHLKIWVKKAERLRPGEKWNKFFKIKKTLKDHIPVSVGQFSSVIPIFHPEFNSPSIWIGFRPEKSKPAKIRIFPDFKNRISHGDGNSTFWNLYFRFAYDLRILKP